MSSAVNATVASAMNATVVVQPIILPTQATVSTVSTVGTKRVKRIEKAFNGDPKEAKKPKKAPVTSSTEPATDVDVTEFQASTGVVRKGDLTYEKKSLHEQILLRADTYIGGVETVTSTDPVWTMVTKTIEAASNPKDTDEEDQESSQEIVTPSTSPRQVEGIGKAVIGVNDGLLRIFVEVLSNAIDNVWQSIQAGVVPKFIKVHLTPTFCRVWNDGRNIPTNQHEKENIPIPELIFGHLLTSSNYNDEQERKTSGRNGYGVKLCNIFSTQFKLTIYNKDEKTLYVQEWSNNMFNRKEPVRTSKGFPKTVEEGKNGFTCVEWTPDFKRFGCSQFSEDMLNMLRKFVYDAAMTVSTNKVQVFLNDQLIPISKHLDYVNMYFPEPPKHMLSLQSSDCYVIIAPAKEWTQVSFVNGVFTREGGVHVDRWVEALFRPVVEKLNGEKNRSVDIRDVKKHFFMFVYADLVNPKFEQQQKHKLNSPLPTVDVKPAIVQKLLKWPFVTQIEEGMKLKEMLTFTKETSRKKGDSKVEGLEDANHAGRKGKDCVLCITEGLSAKTYVVSGIKYGMGKYKGRDTIGVLPIRGKFLNVRNASASIMTKNKELIGITKALGVVYGTDYLLDENFAKLRYKKLVTVCDADHDGFHITGLLYNMFHTLYPTLLARQGFFCFMRVPIIKITSGPAKKQSSLSFYYYEQAKNYIETYKPNPTSIKYFKGLGTSKDADIKEDFGKRLVEMTLDPQADRMMENVFGSDESNFRKNWLLTYKPRTDFPTLKDNEVEKVTVTDFLNLELINYSIDHCRRSIPSIIDGLKESTRKVLFAGFKKNLKHNGPSMKVAQFSNYVAEQTHYHHGENNIIETVIKLAQRFVGSNNLPLFFNDGQFGSRQENGKDAADGRYIFTRLDSCTRLMFRDDDELVLTYKNEEGEQIEPEFFVPIVPFALVNGVQGGIGTGWSSTIPPYSLKDLVAWIKAWLSSESVPTLVPYYRGFQGIVKVEGNKVVTTGIVREEKKRLVVTELPLGRRMISISKYKKDLEDLEEAKVIESIDNQSTENLAWFSFLPVEKKEDDPLLLSKLGLSDSTYTSNMVLFDSNGVLKRYATVNAILEEWCNIRFTFYNKRKEALLTSLKHDATVLYNKIRFCEMVIANKINLKDREEEQLIKELKDLKFDLLPSYDYLLNLSIRNLTSKHLNDLRNKYANVKTATQALVDTSIKDMWSRELDELLVAYDKWIKEQTN